MTKAHITTKVCIACKEEKPIEEFYFIPSKANYDSYCKKCHKKISYNWQKKNPEKTKECRDKYRKSISEPDTFVLGGWKMSVLDYAKKNEYKFTAVHTDGRVYQTNYKEDFINFMGEKL